MRKKLWVLLATAVLFVGMLGTMTALAADASGSFSSNGVEVSINGEAAPVLSGLGKAENYYEAENCSYQGKEKVYVYKDFEISTYPADQKDCINSIYFKTGNASTAGWRKCMVRITQSPGAFTNMTVRDLLLPFTATEKTILTGSSILPTTKDVYKKRGLFGIRVFYIHV